MIQRLTELLIEIVIIKILLSIISISTISMRTMNYSWRIAFFIINIIFSVATENRHVNICESPEPKLLGMYLPGALQDGVATFTNEHDYSFFRNKGFWYFGDLSVWPPATWYRCVLDCSEGEEIPPDTITGNWTINNKYAKDKLPVISHASCPSSSDEL
jgi:hypothetical protein